MEGAAGSGADYEFQGPGILGCKTKFISVEWIFVFSVLNNTKFVFLSSQLFYKNGQPFPAHRPVGLRVNITHIELALDIPVTQEVLQEPESNVVKVAFTVRKAGRYEVAVKLGGLNVAYSPYYKIFQPGITTVSVIYPTHVLICLIRNLPCLD